MEIVKEGTGKLESYTKPMSKMAYGEVCYCIEDECYVLKMPYTDDQFLILGDNDIANSYSGKPSIKVRTLYPGESITIKFS